MSKDHADASADAAPPSGAFWICTGCHRPQLRTVRPLLRGPNQALWALARGASVRFAVLCPPCAERPPGPDEVEVAYDVLREDAAGVDIRAYPGRWRGVTPPDDSP